MAESGRKEKNTHSLYLFTVSVVVAVVWIDSSPWRDGEQHFSQRYVRSGEYCQGCQLTSAREVKLGIRGGAIRVPPPPGLLPSGLGPSATARQRDSKVTHEFSLSRVGPVEG